MQTTGAFPPTKIVVLDGHTLNPGDLSWEELRALGDCAVHDRTPPSQVLERAADAAIVLTNKTVLTADHIRHLPRLRYVGVLATGYNVVDPQTGWPEPVPLWARGSRASRQPDPREKISLWHLDGNAQ